jgi:hypothetical protein
LSTFPFLTCPLAADADTDFFVTGFLAFFAVDFFLLALFTIVTILLAKNS